MMVVKKKSKKKKKKKKKVKTIPMEIDTDEVPSTQQFQQQLNKLQSFNQSEAKYDENKQEQKLNQKQLSQYNFNHHCSQLIWCEVSLQNKRYLNFLKLYQQTPKEATLNDLFNNTMLQYIDKSYFNQKYKNIQNDINAFCVLLWTSNDCHKYKKIPKGIDKSETNSFQIYKYLQNSIINDDKTGLGLSMQVIRCINNVINNCPTTQQLIGYRGSKMSVKEFNEFVLNEQRRIGMYVACSTNKEIAEMFIGKGHVLITIVIPVRCLNARIVPSPMTMFPNEKEILIPPYSLFQCMGKKITIRNDQTVRELVLLLTKDNKIGKFDGLKNVPYWTA